MTDMACVTCAFSVNNPPNPNCLHTDIALLVAAVAVVAVGANAAAQQVRSSVVTCAMTAIGCGRLYTPALPPFLNPSCRPGPVLSGISSFQHPDNPPATLARSFGHCRVLCCHHYTEQAR